MKLCKCNQLVLKLSYQDVHSITDQIKGHQQSGNVQNQGAKRKFSLVTTRKEKVKAFPQALHCILKTFKY